MFYIQLGLFNGRTIIRCITVWFTAGLLILIISTGIVKGFALGVGSIGYISSAVSFLSAIAAGMTAGEAAESKRVIAGALCGVILTALLLIIGFLVKGSHISSDGVISVVSFTLSGCIAGAFLAPNKKHSVRNRNAFRLKR